MLCYLLVYLSNNYECPELIFPNSTQNNSENRLYFLQAYRHNYTLNHMIKFLAKIEHGLLVFCQEVEKLTYN